MPDADEAADTPVAAALDPEFEALLDYLLQVRRFDFHGYKRNTLLRRMQRRLTRLGLQSWAEYRDHLEVNPEEITELFNTILINVTSFFRDREAWAYLEREVVPRILLNRSDGGPLRVWSAGCASGEEAYSLAIVLAEALGREAFLARVKIYATDVDEQALAQARAGYEPRSLASIDADLRSRYFEAAGDRFVFDPGLRRPVIFGRHDILQDAPISRLDLLVCRNTLMYFTAESQTHILERFRYALRDDGFLFLGRAEMLVSNGHGFTPVNARHRIFRRSASEARQPIIPDDMAATEVDEFAARQVRLALLAADAAPVAEIIVDRSGKLVGANERARHQFRLRSEDIGRPLNDLEVSYRPLELRSRLEQAWRQRSPVVVSGIDVVGPGGTGLVLTVTVHPFQDGHARLLGAGITFEDVTAEYAMQRELDRSRSELEAAYEELESTNEELETTNEELQSTVEELETTNEELQSTNEELETMNEELESTNAELQTVNIDLGQRQETVGAVNAFLEAVLRSVRLGVAVVDADQRVTMWNERAHDLWGVQPGEAVGRAFDSLDIGLPLDQVTDLIRRGLASGGDAVEIEVPAVNRRGRSFTCRLMATPLPSAVERSRGVVVLMEAVEGA